MTLTMNLENSKIERIFYAHVSRRDELEQFIQELQAEFSASDKPLIVEIWKSIPERKLHTESLTKKSKILR